MQLWPLWFSPLQLTRCMRWPATPEHWAAPPSSPGQHRRITSERPSRTSTFETEERDSESGMRTIYDNNPFCDAFWEREIFYHVFTIIKDARHLLCETKTWQQELCRNRRVLWSRKHIAQLTGTWFLTKDRNIRLGKRALALHPYFPIWVKKEKREDQRREV